MGFWRILCQRSLATSVDVDRIILRNSRPLLFSESGRRHDRIWEKIRLRLGRDTFESGTAFAKKLGIPILASRNFDQDVKGT